jgi:hypothetical protein
MNLPEGMKQAILAMESGLWKVEVGSTGKTVVVGRKNTVSYRGVIQEPVGYVLRIEQSEGVALWFPIGGQNKVFGYMGYTGPIPHICTALGLGELQEVAFDDYVLLLYQGINAYLDRAEGALRLPEGMKQKVLAMEPGVWWVYQGYSGAGLRVTGKKLNRIDNIPGYWLLLGPYEEGLWFPTEGRDYIFMQGTHSIPANSRVLVALGLGGIRWVSPEVYRDIRTKGLEYYLKQRVVG